MALFLGTSVAKVDAKGRTSVPADFRAAVACEAFAGVVLYHSFTGKCIEGCTYSRMEKLADASDSLDVFGEERENISSLVFSDARPLSFDTAGRIVVPADLLAFAGVKDSALFVGKGKTFQIWERGAFDAAQKLEREKAARARPTLKIAGS